MPSGTHGERPLRLLIVERFGWFARTLATVLDAAGWTVVRADTGLKALALVETTSPDAIIVRDDLDDTTPIDLCVALRDVRQVGLVTPIVVVATDAARTQHLAALRAGAWEYVVQPLDTDALILKLTNLAHARRDVERLASAALVDAETGLYNRSGLQRRSEEVEADARRRRAPLSCVVFAPEENGDATDDGETTARVGALLRRRGRASDVIGRIGNVLAVIAPSTGADGAARLAERVGGMIQGMQPADSAGPQRPIRVRAAYCAAADFAQSTMRVSEMLERAQDALRRAPADVEGPLSVPCESVPPAPPPG